MKHSQKALVLLETDLTSGWGLIEQLVLQVSWTGRVRGDAFSSHQQFALSHFHQRGFRCVKSVPEDTACLSSVHHTSCTSSDRSLYTSVPPTPAMTFLCLLNFFLWFGLLICICWCIQAGIPGLPVSLDSPTWFHTHEARLQGLNQYELLDNIPYRGVLYRIPPTRPSGESPNREDISTLRLLI